MANKILIVDDSAAFRRLLRSFLSVEAVISECEDGGAAVAAFGDVRPDWVVMDVDMKPVDGLTATRMIKAQYPEARVLILTQHNDDLLRQEAFAAGAEDYATKEELPRVSQLVSHGGVKQA